MKTNQPLGRGLSALLGGAGAGLLEKPAQNNESVNAAASMMDINKIYPNKAQPRMHFDETKIKELAESIKKNGLISPIIVQAMGDKYQIIAGERRWRASKMAGLKEVPIIVKNINDNVAFEIALIENIQREDLNPIEEALGYKTLMEKFNYTQEKVSEVMGKSRSHVANFLRLLNLPEVIQGYVMNGQITTGHARAIINVDNQEEICHRIIQEGLSVRQVEELVKSGDTGLSLLEKKSKSTSKIKAEKDVELIAIEDSLSTALGMKVSIDSTDDGGKIAIHFKDLEQLDLLMQKLS